MQDWNLTDKSALSAGLENDGQKSSREKLLDGGLPLPTPFRYHLTTYSFLLIHLVPVI